MEATEKNVLLGLLTKSLNKTDEEISELLYQKAEDSEEVILRDEALDLVLDANAKHISNVKKSAKPDDKALNDQYLKGKKEGKAELEAEIKTLTGLETNSIGADLVKEAVNHLSDCNVPTEEQIKAHPLYVSLEKDRVPKGDYDDMKKEFDEYKLNIDQSQRFSRVEGDVLTIHNGLNPIVSENPVVAQTRQRDFLNRFKDYDYDVSEDGNHLVKQNGSRMEDAHGNPVKFADFVKGISSQYYEFKVGQEGDNAGNSNDGGGGGGSIGAPKTYEDYMSQMAELMKIKDPNGRTQKTVALRKAWEESQSK